MYRQQLADAEGNRASLRAQLKVVKKRRDDAEQKFKKAKTDLASAEVEYDKQMKKTANAKNDAEMQKWGKMVADLKREKQTLESNVNALFAMTQGI